LTFRLLAKDGRLRPDLVRRGAIFGLHGIFSDHDSLCRSTLLHNADTKPLPDQSRRALRRWANLSAKGHLMTAVSTRFPSWDRDIGTFNLT
jgi:hypothetical protein